MTQQLPLGVRLRDDASLDNFLPGANAAVLLALKAFLTDPQEQMIYLWGGAGCGKSHLLQALCHQAGRLGVSAAYFPLENPQDLAPDMCQGLEHYPLVCLDDLQAIAGQPAWEQALFHLYNRVRDSGGRLLVAADRPPSELGLLLPDLVSRLAWGVVFPLQELSESDKIAALQLRARQRGLQLTAEVAVYLLRRMPRDMTALYTLLERLDQASLVAKRSLTIPFVRQVLNQD